MWIDIILFILTGYGIYIAYYYFVPWYKTDLRERIRKWIVQRHLDASGQQIKRNMSDSNEYLNMLEITERMFGWDIPSESYSSDTTAKKCIFAKG